MKCCQGRNPWVTCHWNPTVSISLRAWASVILCNGLIGTDGSSARYSNRINRPPGRNARNIDRAISYGCENSW